MEAFAHQLFSGLFSGGVYASIALSLVMIYQSTHHINFAQGEMATFSAFVAWTLLQLGFSYWTAFGLTVVFSFFAGVAIQRILLRPIENSSALVNVIVFIALLVILNALSGMLFGHSIKAFPSPFPTSGWWVTSYMSGHQLGALCTMLLVLFAVYGILSHTKLGLSLRAAAYNPQSARLVGIRVSWMLAIGWGLAAAIGAIAGIMVAPALYLDPNMMSGVLLYGFAGALLGGIDSPWGAVIGGLLVGIFENLLGAYVIGTELKLSVALIIIVGILTLKPNGFFGKNTVVRV